MNYQGTPVNEKGKGGQSRPCRSQQPTNSYVKSDCVDSVSTVRSQYEYAFCMYRAGLCSSSPTSADQRQNLLLHCAFPI